MTARDLINSAMRLIGVLASGETLSANEASDALVGLNQMVDTWSTENLLIYAKGEEEFPLVAGQQSYTMGPSGNFNTSRPLVIENAYIRTLNGSNTVDLPLDVVNQDQWANITNKSTSSSFPRKLFPQGTYPLETILVWPVPSETKTLVLWSWKPLASIATLDSIIDLPPGYAKALRYNVAIEYAPEYGKTPDGLVLVQAAESKAAIKRMNSKPLYLSSDAALLSKGSSFNWRTGE